MQLFKNKRVIARIMNRIVYILILGPLNITINKSITSNNKVS